MHCRQVYSLTIDQNQIDLSAKYHPHQEPYQPNLNDELFLIVFKLEIRTIEDYSSSISSDNILPDKYSKESTDLAGNKMIEEQSSL